MPKIVSREDTNDAVVTRLQEVLKTNSLGAISNGRHAVASPSPDLAGLVDQTESLLQSMIQTLDHAAVDLSIARTETIQLSLKVDELESIVENLMGDVSFDEALDSAAEDLMDGLAQSGASEIGFDGEVVFNERVTLRKADLKPYLQQAITTWIEQRLSA